MSQLGPTQHIYRASCNSVEVKLRVNVDCAWLLIKKRGEPAIYVEIEDVDEVLRQFKAIKGDAERFDQFVALGLLMFQNWKEQPNSGG